MEHFANLGNNCLIEDRVRLGFKYRAQCLKARIGDNAVIRAMSLIYGDVVIGHNFKAGRGVVVRGNTFIGNDVELDNGVIIEGNVQIGNGVTIGAGSYVPADVIIGNQVRIGAEVVLSLDRRLDEATRQAAAKAGMVIGDKVIVGARSMIYPGVHIGDESYIMEGARVTADIPPQSMASGVPAKIFPLTRELAKKLKMEFSG
ncbi:DapH/DapD/GlmU-related protein [Nitrospina watsonii]|uniref:Transferase hexapeptide repeat n=1 Tax=Nitrospina watsonii TaxID=1323948 RepID=A0ABM9HA30_9BACT|nr:DapH/DapD/GlmU-related protein [Nitrospina watsonii]CAI2716994.1 Transferase hexapeptide repeat [Nitrospina watsonii]